MEEAIVEIHVAYEGWNTLRRFPSLAKARRFTHLLRRVRCTCRWRDPEDTYRLLRIILVVDEEEDIADYLDTRDYWAPVHQASLTEIANALRS